MFLRFFLRFGFGFPFGFLEFHHWNNVAAIGFEPTRLTLSAGDGDWGKLHRKFTGGRWGRSSRLRRLGKLRHRNMAVRQEGWLWRHRRTWFGRYFNGNDGNRIDLNHL